VALWIPLFRRLAIATSIAVHAVALLVLGPLGHDYNLVVWPWNLAMIALVIALFPPVRLRQSLLDLRASLPGAVAVAAICLLPILSYSGRWNSYFSFALYSGNLAKADIFLTPSMVNRLPESIRPFAHPVHPDVAAVSPNLAGLFVFDYLTWCQSELGVPPIPEPHSYRSIARYLAPFASAPTDLHLVMQPRGGTVRVLRANDLR
jgi:hypothetical protein